MDIFGYHVSKHGNKIIFIEMYLKEIREAVWKKA